MSFYLSRQMFLSRFASDFFRKVITLQKIILISVLFLLHILWSLSLPCFHRQRQCGCRKKENEAIITKNEIYLNINKVSGVLHSSTSPAMSLFLHRHGQASSKVLAHLSIFHRILFPFFLPSTTANIPERNEIPFDTDTYDSLPTENEKLYLSHNEQSSKNKFYHFEVSTLARVFISKPNEQTPSNNESFLLIMIFQKKK